MSLRTQTEASLVGFEKLGAQTQVATLRAIEADLRRALSSHEAAGTAAEAGEASAGRTRE